MQPKRCMGGGGSVAECIHNPGRRWTWILRFTPQLPYLWYPLSRKLDSS